MRIRGAKMESEKDRADELLRLMREGLADHSNLGACVFALAREKRGVQHRVLDALRGPKQTGRPRKGISDDEWLSWLEAYRAQMVLSYGRNARKPSDLGVIVYGLKNSGTRYGRNKGEPFREHTPSGKAEVKRIRDAVVRARRNRKKPSNNLGNL